MKYIYSLLIALVSVVFVAEFASASAGAGTVVINGITYQVSSDGTFEKAGETYTVYRESEAQSVLGGASGCLSYFYLTPFIGCLDGDGGNYIYAPAPTPRYHLVSDDFGDVIIYSVSAMGLLVGLVVVIGATRFGFRIIKSLFPNAY